jgi:RNA polymerase sigma factor (sigma-70 family)
MATLFGEHEELCRRLRQRAARSGSLTGEVEEAFCEHAVAVGYLRARRYGLNHQDSQDCAMTFVVLMLVRLRHEGTTLLDMANYAGWIHRCAHDHAAKFRRALSRHDKRRLGLEAADAHITPAHLQSLQQSEAALLREAFWQAVSELETRPAAIFVAYYRDGAHLAEIAALFECSPAAVKQSLYRSRKRVAERLEQRGWTAAMLSSVLASESDGAG